MSVRNWVRQGGLVKMVMRSQSCLLFDGCGVVCVLRPLTAPRSCFRLRQGAPKWYVSVFRPKSGMLWLCVLNFFTGVSSIIAFVATKQCCRSAIRTNTPVQRQICCLSHARGVTVVVSGPSVVSVEFRLVRSCQQWIGVASVCRTFLVSRGWLKCSL